MTTEKMTDWIKAWNQPPDIGYDRDFVRGLQAQLLAIHRTDNKVNLFAVLKDGPNAIAKKLDELGVQRSVVVTALDDVNTKNGVPRDVPPFFLIAKMTGLITPEIADQLLVVQACARMLNNSRLSLENVPSLNDALDSNLFAHIGKNDKEPKELQVAQSYAHLALIHQALIKETPVASGVRYDGAHRQMAYASIAHGILTQARDTLNKLGVSDAVASIDSVLPEFVLPPKEHDPASVIAQHILGLHHDIIVAATGGEYTEEVGHQASVIHNRTQIIAGVTNGDGSAPGAPKQTL